MQTKQEAAASKLRWLTLVLVLLLALDGYLLVTALRGDSAPVPLSEDVPRPIPLLYSPYVYLDTVEVTNWVVQYDNLYYYLAIGEDDSVHLITANDLDRLRADLAAQNPLRLYGTVSAINDGVYPYLGQALDISQEEAKQLVGTLCMHPYFSPSRAQWQSLGLTACVTLAVGAMLFSVWRKRRATA